jgi:hypothetical protein
MTTPNDDAPPLRSIDAEPRRPGAVGAPARRDHPQPAHDPAVHAERPLSPLDPDAMHRREDDAAAQATSRDFSERAPTPEDVTGERQP